MPIGSEITSLLLRQGDIAAQQAQQSGQITGNAFHNIGQDVSGAITQATDPKRLEYQRQQKGRALLAATIKSTPPGADGTPDYKTVANTLGAGGFPDLGEAYLSSATNNEENIQKLSNLKATAAKAARDYQAHQLETVGDVAFHADTPEKFTASVGYLAAHGQIDEKTAQGILAQADQGGPDGWKAIRDQFVQHSPLWLKEQEERKKPVVLPPTSRGGAPAELVIDGKVVAQGGTPPVDPTIALTQAREEEIARHNKETERISALTEGKADAAQKETARHNRAMEAAANPFGAPAGGGAGGPGAQGPTGDDFLKGLQPGVAAQVKALAEGRQPFPTGMSYAKLQPLIQLVTQYDPTFDAANYTARSKARTDLTSPSGTGGKTINSLNTAIQHLGRLSDLIETEDNSNIPIVNAVVNPLRTAGGSTKITNFNAVQPQAMKEIERLWRGAGGSEGDINALKDSLSKNAGRQQQREALQEFVNLVRGKLDSTEQQRDNILGPAAKDVPILFDQNKPILEKIGQRASGAPVAAELSVKAPDGKTYSFKSKADLDAFKKAAGL